MAHYCLLAMMWIVMASYMTLLVTAGTQSIDAASAISSEACAHKTTQQQPQQQPQPNLQHQQQQLNSNLVPELYTLLDKINYPSRFPLSNPNEYLQHALDINDPFIKLGDVNGLSQNYDFYLNNGKTPYLMYAHGVNAEPNTRVNGDEINEKSEFTSDNEPSLYFPNEKYTELSKRPAPYFLGKRRMYSFNNEDLPMPVEKRSAPMFVGRRGQSGVFKNAEHFYPNSRLGDLALWKDVNAPASYLSEAARIGKGRMSNGSILNVNDKRGAPKFVGKRLSVLDEGSSLLKHKRGAPRFVGKRKVPYFVGKRLSQYYRPDLASLDYSRDGRMKQPDDDDSTYYSNKRGAPIFVGKRLHGSGYLEEGVFEEKRGAPRFVGRSVPVLLDTHQQPRFAEEQRL
ncbi:hypothetical protein BsWGS_13877 [Bradybaena similaris]